MAVAWRRHSNNEDVWGMRNRYDLKVYGGTIGRRMTYGFGGGGTYIHVNGVTSVSISTERRCQSIVTVVMGRRCQLIIVVRFVKRGTVNGIRSHVKNGER